MNLRLALVAVAACLAANSSLQADDTGPTRHGDRGAAVIGRRLENFTLPDPAGKPASLDALVGARATVLVFLSVECPMSIAYLKPLEELAAELGDTAVRILLIHANADEGAEQVVKYVREFDIRLLLLRDVELAVAGCVGAKVTPEAFLLDADRVVRYRGRIDDQYLSRLKRREHATRTDLRAAIDELLAGKPVSRPETEALGCPISHRMARKTQPAGAVTFNRDVLQILQARCQMCHRPGQAAPFALMNYGQAVKWAADIERVTAERLMPPWKPVAGFGKFRNEQRLSESEIATIAAWVKAGVPEGDPADLPPPREFPDSGWQLGEPDLVLTMPDEFEVHATGRDLIRHFVIATNLDEDKWVKAIEFHAGNTRVAHHAIVFTDTTGSARRYDAIDPQPGFGRGGFFVSNIGAWAVGTQPNPLPEGVGQRLPQGADIVLQMHYHPSGRVEKDRSTVGVYFAKDPVQKQLASLPVFGLRFVWPEGEERIRTTGRITVPVDCHAIQVFPHMHMLGKEITITATRPDGTVEPLIRIDDWDFNWQQFYSYQSPVALPKGTVIELESYADNSSRNPSNPNHPPQTVRFGEQTTNEMCIGFLGCTVDDDSEFREIIPFRRVRPRAAEKQTQP